MPNISISEFSSLNFRTDWKKDFQTDVSYFQKFLSTDTILVQYSVPVTEPFGIIPRVINETTILDLIPEPVYTDDDGTITYNATISDLPYGGYSFQLVQNSVYQNIIAQTSFCIKEDLPDSVLIRYSHYRNEFGVVFDQSYFYFRVEGTFLPQEVTPQAQTEVFRDQRYSLTQLSAFPYEKNILTVGGGHGVPNWVARKLNLIFSLSEVAVDGKIYTRSEGAAPEITVLHQNYPLYIYKIELEPDNEQSIETDFLVLYPVVTAEQSPVVDSQSNLLYSL